MVEQFWDYYEQGSQQQEQQWEENLQLAEFQPRVEIVNLQHDVENGKKYNESIKNVWEKEIDIFNRVFMISPWNTSFFIDKVKQIQLENIDYVDRTDWVISEQTLKIIYTEVYYYEKEKTDFPFSFDEKTIIEKKINDYLNSIVEWTGVEKEPESNLESKLEDSNFDKDLFIEKRKDEIEQEMILYNQNPKAIFSKSKLNILTNKNYFASIKWKKWIIFDNSPIDNEQKKFISKWLDETSFNDTLAEWENRIFVSKINWKVALRFYIDWKLYLSTLVSPWILKKPTDQNIYSWVHNTHKHHISSDYPEKDVEKWIMRDWWAIMPYAVSLANGIWIHGSDSEINWKLQSHWCIRTPLYYAKEIYEKVNEIQESWETITIDTRWIYN